MQTLHTSKSPKWQTLVYIVLTLILLGLAVTLISINLENQVIMAFDEARHGVNGYEMIRNDDFLVHTYQGEPDFWNLKPPLSYWLIALHFKLFGYNCVAFRLHSAIATVFTLLAATLWTKKRHGMVVSLLVLLFLIINPALYGLNFARTGEADALHTLFVTLSMLCLLSSSRDIRWLYGSALGFGFSFLAKSYHAAIIPMMCLLYLVLTGEVRKLKLKNYLLLFLFGLLPILPWAIARYLRDGFTFFTQMFTTDVQARVSVDVDGKAAGNWYFYLLQLLRNPVAVAYSAMGAAALIWCKFFKPLHARKRETVGLLIWILFPLFLYSLSNFKLYHYIVPVMVPISMVGAMAAYMLFRQIKRREIRAAFCALLIAGIAWQTTLNFKAVIARDDKGSMQATIAGALDRDINSETHVYIQYNNGRTRWMQNDMLRALLSGDVICLDGGAEAFEEDDESALLIIDREGMDEELLEYYPIYYESGYQYQYVLEK